MFSLRKKQWISSIKKWFKLLTMTSIWLYLKYDRFGCVWVRHSWLPTNISSGEIWYAHDLRRTAAVAGAPMISESHGHPWLKHSEEARSRIWILYQKFHRTFYTCALWWVMMSVTSNLGKIKLLITTSLNSSYFFLWVL